MTIELKREAAQRIKYHNKELDSLHVQLNSEQNDTFRAHILEVISAKKLQADNYNYNFSVEKTEIIWKRINAYAEEFAKVNNYELILGAQQNSNVIYGDEQIDITADFLQYLNQRYEDNN